MNENSMEYSVREYIKEIGKNLPEWLKDKKEHKEILADLEEHLWSKAAELSETGQPDEKSVKLAIDHLGTPHNIAKEYKRRGEPKFYITKELWSLYIKTLSTVFAVIVLLVIIGMIASFFTGSGSFETLVGGLITGIQTGLLLAFTIVTIVFVALSMEGYFPEDFKSKKEQKLMKQLREQEIGEGVPASQTLKQPLKPFIKPAGEIIGGGIGLILLINNIDEEPLKECEKYLNAFGDFVDSTGVTIGVTRMEVKSTPSIDDYQRLLKNRNICAPVIEVDPRNEDDVILLMESLLYSIDPGLSQDVEQLE